MKSKLFGKVLAMILAAVMLLGLIPAMAMAAPQDSFVLVAEAGGRLVIQPEYVTYTQGQTVKNALKASKHTFEGIDENYITAIDGVKSGSYVRGDQDGNYELDTAASAVTHYRFVDSSSDAKPSQELMQLMTAMADYKLETKDVQQAAKAAYDKAVKEFVGADSAKARTLADGITEAITAYKNSLNGETFNVTFKGFTKADYPDIVLTAANENGKVYSDDDGDGVLQLPVGTYQFTISHNHNHIEGTVEVKADVSVTAAFPTEQWLNTTTAAFSDTYAADFDAGKMTPGTWNDRAVTVPVVDSFTGTVYTFMESQKAKNPTLRAIYTDASGKEVTMELAFGSKVVGPEQVLAKGAKGNTVIYRVSSQDASGYTLSQDYTVTFTRIPTLTGIGMVDQNDRAQSATAKFAPRVTDYTYKVLQEVTDVTVTPQALDKSYKVTVNGQSAGEKGVTVALKKDDTGASTVTDITVEVASEGVSSTYLLHVRPGEGKSITFVTTAADVELKVVNKEGLELPYTKYKDTDTYNRYLYNLVPGDEYHYVAMRDQYFFAEDTFTLGEDSSITVDVPAEHWLKEALLCSTSSKTSTYEMDQPFKPENHRYTLTAPDNKSMCYTWATSIPSDVKVEAVYNQVDKSEKYHGVEATQTITSDATKGVSLSRVLMNRTPVGNTVTLRVSKSKSGTGIVYYQNYIFEIHRQLTLNKMNVMAGDAPVILYQNGGTARKFNSDVRAYTVTVPMAQQSLNIEPLTYADSSSNLPFGQTSNGYTVSVNGTDVTGQSANVNLSGTMATETVTVTVGSTMAPDNTGDYVITVKKAAPVNVTVKVEPADALLFVSESSTNTRIWPKNGSFDVSDGFSYSYSITKPGYVGQGGTLTVARDEKENLILKMGEKTFPVERGDDGVTGVASVSVSLQKAAPNTTINPDIPAQWPNFRGNYDNNAVTTARTPIQADDTTLYWAQKIGKNWSDAAGCPIVVDGDLILTHGKYISRVDATTGKIKDEASMVAASSFAIMPPAYAQGMIFMQLGNGIVQAFDAKTLESLWVYHDPLKGQSNTSIAVCGDYLYTGYWSGETKEANFVCLTLTDEDPGNSKEEKTAVWRFTQKGGFYWAGAYTCPDYILVGTDDGMNGCESQTGRILMLDAKTGALLDSWDGLAGDVRSNVARSGDSFYVTSKGGSFYSFKITQENGSYKITDKWSVVLQNGSDRIAMSTSTPAICNGRAYIGVAGTSQFGAYSGHNITVIDLDTRSIAYSVPTAGYPQTSGLVSTAYQAENGYTYVYFLDNMTPGALRVLRDKPGMTAPDYVVQEKDTNAAYPIFTPTGEQAQYAICSPLVDDYGTLYFKNDSGYLMAVGSTVERLEVTKQPDKVEYSVGETFDATGMEITAVYTNGTSRDVTSAVTFRAEPMTADTKAITVEFAYGLYGNRENVGSMDVGVNTPAAVVEIPVTITDAPMLGDVNLDKKIDDADAQLILDVEAQNKTLEARAAANADVSGDGKVNSDDAVLIRQFVAKKIQKFPAEKTPEPVPEQITVPAETTPAK